jgi:uncharacterized membrane protein YbhN (UPF0104 family)
LHAVNMGPSLRWFTRRVRVCLVWLDEKPLAVVLVAAGATVGVTIALASSAGWPHVLGVVYRPHSWLWLALCGIGEGAAYGGYVLTLRDIARVDDGPDLDLVVSAKAVVGGFGVFAATRGSGGFAVDYWAFRHAGADKRDAFGRVLALGFLEYLVLSVVALVASALLYWHLDGHASDGVTLPGLLIVPSFAVGLWLTSPKRVRRLSKRQRSSGWLRTTFANSVLGIKNVRGLLTSPREHGLGVLGMALYWVGDIVCLWAALQVVGGRHLTVSALILAHSGGYVLTRRSLPAGGARLVEVALTLALVGMGARFAPALIGVVLYRLFNFWLPIVPALLLIPTLRQLRTRFQEAERDRAGAA